MGRVVLVTGVSRYLGGRYACAIAAQPGVDQVIGVDVIPPPHDIGNAQFVRADIRNPVIAKVIDRAGVDTVVHLSVIATPTGAGGRTSMKEINVIGTMQLLAACQRSRGVKRLVVKSTGGVYGSSPRDPAVFTEETSARVLPRSGWAKDAVEVEGYVRGFSRRRPDVAVSILRLANFIGPTVRTTLTDYFSRPVLPGILGYEPRLQFIHEDDGIAALIKATMGDSSGVVNVAGDGVITLSQAAGMIGSPLVWLPRTMAGPLGAVLNATGLADFSDEQIDFLAFGRCMDTARMRTRLEFEPEYTTRQAFESFITGQRVSGPITRDRIESVERSVLSLVGQLRAGIGRMG